jgi:hypothetical protein
VKAYINAGTPSKIRGIITSFPTASVEKATVVAMKKIYNTNNPVPLGKIGLEYFSKLDIINF